MAGANLPLSASVVDPDTVLAQVQFFLDGNPLATLSADPFVFNASAPATPGSHSVQAVATDLLGRTNTSTATITVTAAIAAAPPTSSVLTPVAGRSLPVSSVLALSVAAASDPTTALDHVSLYANGTLVATFVPGDASTQAIPAPAGQPTRRAATVAATNVFQTLYTLPGTDQFVNLVAVALDKLGQSSVSRIASVHSTMTADQPPLITLNGLVNGAHVKVGSTNAVTITATAASTNGISSPGKTPRDAPAAGTLALLEFYLNGAKLGEALAPPYSFTFTPPASGKYVLDAVATDTAGLSSLTDPVTVQADPAPTVSLAVGGTGEAEEGGANGVIIVSRTGDTTEPLMVSYKTKGAPVAGVDYKKLPGTVLIPAGAVKAKIKVKPIDGSPNASTLKLKLQLLPATDDSYEIGTGTVKLKLVGH